MMTGTCQGDHEKRRRSQKFDCEAQTCAGKEAQPRDFVDADVALGTGCRVFENELVAHERHDQTGMNSDAQRPRTHAQSC
jgi:hypothetical protein